MGFLLRFRKVVVKHLLPSRYLVPRSATRDQPEADLINLGGPSSLLFDLILLLRSVHHLRYVPRHVHVEDVWSLFERLYEISISHRFNFRLHAARAPIPSGWSIHHISRLEKKRPKEFSRLPLQGSIPNHTTIATVFSAHTDRLRYGWIMGIG